jgi:hypothetical protein
MERFILFPKLSLNAPLMLLLSRYRTKQCSIPRDRIYSLLALAAKDNLCHVDYNLSELDLFFLVLERCKKNFCFCTVGLLARVLGLASAHIPGDHLQTRYPYVEFDIDSCAFRRPEKLSLWKEDLAAVVYGCVWDNPYTLFDNPWTVIFNTEGDPDFVHLGRRNYSIRPKDLTNWYNLASQKHTDGFVLKKNCLFSHKERLRIPLLVWLQLFRTPVELCDRGRGDMSPKEPPPSLRIGYTNGVKGGEGFIGQVLPKMPMLSVHGSKVSWWECCYLKTLAVERLLGTAVAAMSGLGYGSLESSGALKVFYNEQEKDSLDAVL